MNLLKTNSSFRYLLLFSITLFSINQFFLLALINITENTQNPSSTLGSAMTLLTISKIVILPISGYLVDYFKEKKILFFSSIVFVLFFLIVFWQSSFIDYSVKDIYFYAIVSGIILGMTQPSTLSIIPKIIQSNQHSEANSLFQTSSQLSQFISPSIAGFFIGNLSKSSYYLIIIFLSLFCLYFSIKMNVNYTTDFRRPVHTNKTSIAEYRIILQNSSIISLLLLTAIINFSTSGSLQVALPMFVNHELNQNTSTYGYFISIYGFGSFIGSFGSILFKKKHETLSLLLIFSAYFGFIWMIILQCLNLFFVITLLLLSGIFIGMINVLYMSVLQNSTPEHLFGRVTSVQLFFSTVLTPVSFFITGKLTSLYSASTIFSIAGLLIIFIVVFISILNKSNQYKSSNH
ncbi:MFS transporter [Vagococcus acidifermentans]|uniref:Major facilitator superfamily (MFS) profile domain-containing protein n=1 Tax=Vagococcus acidifermentans TaxID=564710 RepID=A0A430AUK7_9ENTE|nr:MFS transporter [Vagococcus acidifermentans]RSU11740.1 hypothetical protein CBF27_07200 [Vagococcus acidifermentans]